MELADRRLVFQHPSIAALRRALLRNGQLRDLCAGSTRLRAAALPSEYAYTRFQRRLREHQGQVQELFHSALDELQIELLDLGQVQGLDGKELHPLAKGASNYPLPKDRSYNEDTDGRRDRDADWGVKGSGEKKHYWFGYLLHLVVDATYELPLAFEVTKASTAEQPQAQRLLDQMQDRHPQLLERCHRLSADKGYDDHKLIERLWDQHRIKPIIAIRDCWRDGDATDDNGQVTRVVIGQHNVIYTLRWRSLVRVSAHGCGARHGLWRLRAGSRDAEVSLSGALLWDHMQRDGSVSRERRGTHPAGRGPAGVHAGGTFQLPVAGLLRPAPRCGAGQQPVGRRLRVRASGHPRAGQDAPARHHGDDHHAGDGPGPHPRRSVGTPAESGQTRLSGDRTPVTTTTHPPAAQRDRSDLNYPPSDG